MLVFLDRHRRSGHFLEWKVRLFSVAAVIALAGIFLDERWMTAVAIVVLAAAMSLRFLPGGMGEDVHAGDDEDGSG